MTNARSAKSTREKAAELRAVAERQAARRRALIAGAAVIVVMLVVVGTYVLVRTLQKQRDDKVAAATAPPANLYTPPGGTAGFLIGKPTAKVTVDIYEDFQCPACKSFEEANGAMLKQYADTGKVKLIYHPVAILDRYSTTNYSTRSLNAAAAVNATSPTAFGAYHSELFANQPPENGDGLPDATLIDLGVKAGATQTQIETAITTLSYSGWVTKTTDDFVKAFPPGSTPTVAVNGRKLDPTKDELAPATLKVTLDKAITAAG